MSKSSRNLQFSNEGVVLAIIYSYQLRTLRAAGGVTEMGRVALLSRGVERWGGVGSRRPRCSVADTNYFCNVTLGS